MIEYNKYDLLFYKKILQEIKYDLFFYKIMKIFCSIIFIILFYFSFKFFINTLYNFSTFSLLLPTVISFIELKMLSNKIKKTKETIINYSNKYEKAFKKVEYNKYISEKRKEKIKKLYGKRIFM